MRALRTWTGSVLMAMLVPTLMPLTLRAQDSPAETAAETMFRGPVSKSGYVSGRTFRARPVTYSLVGDQAVMQGDILLGTEAEMKRLIATVNLLKALEDMPDENGFGTIDNRRMNSIQRSAYSNINTQAKRVWTDATIPYLIDTNIERPERITDAMKHWTDNTPIRFVPWEKKHKNYVYFRRVDKGCASYIGMKGADQDLWVGPECTKGNMIHELGHAIGLWHEHCREDNSNHITINFTNIAASDHKEFKGNTAESDDFGSYDYGSVMHYGRDAFAVDKSKDTITPKSSGVTIGQRDAPSGGDIAGVKKIYP